jgi:RNA polymerase sigma factor (sigma-70 family)
MARERKKDPTLPKKRSDTPPPFHVLSVNAMVERQEIDLEGFYSGERRVLAEVYRRYVAGVERAVSCYCRGAEAECVVHEVFLRIIESEGVRRQFQGDDLSAWLRTAARRRAIDHLRRARRWSLLDEPRSLEGALPPIDEEGPLIHRDQVRHLTVALERFAAEVLPTLDPRLAQVYRMRLQERVPQSEAARALDLPRATFIEREQRLMARLGRFLREHLGERRR